MKEKTIFYGWQNTASTMLITLTDADNVSGTALEWDLEIWLPKPLC